MSDKSFLVAGDVVMFTPTFEGTGVLMAPAVTPILSTSKNTASFRGITLEGDEKKWIVLACPYTKPPYVVPGVLTCKIKKLHDFHIAKKIQEGSTPVLLVGSVPFDAEFQVVTPARQLPPPAGGDNSPDPSPIHVGKGTFIQAVDSKAMNGD